MTVLGKLHCIVLYSLFAHTYSTCTHAPPIMRGSMFGEWNTHRFVVEVVKLSRSSPWALSAQRSGLGPVLAKSFIDCFLSFPQKFVSPRVRHWNCSTEKYSQNLDFCTLIKEHLNVVVKFVYISTLNLGNFINQDIFFHLKEVMIRKVHWTEWMEYMDCNQCFWGVTYLLHYLTITTHRTS